MSSANENGRGKSTARRWLALLPVALGAALVALLVLTRPGVERATGQEEARPVSVIPVPAVRFVPRALGFGTVRPGQTWKGVAEVGGRVVERAGRLDSGNLVQAGQELIRIDPADYELRVEEVKAAIQAKEAQLDQLDTRAENTRRSLAIERDSLALAREQLGRQRELLRKDSIASSDVDQQRRQVLQQETVVQNLENSLSLIPVERRALQAELARDRVRLRQAERDLEHTVIRAPFDARVGEVAVERSQFVSPGQTLVTLDGIDVAEVPAQLPVGRFRDLLRAAALPVPLTSESMQELLAEQGLSAIVRLPFGDGTVSWEARVDRISEALDPKTRTVGVVVAVDEPYRKARPPERPPLVRNMYVEVELRGEPRPDTLVLPRASLHGDRVYVVGADGRLELRPVRLGARQGDLVAVEEGLEAGEKVLVADLVPAIGGMLLEPEVDSEALERLRASAAAETPLP